ncbi:hypothetical protein [Evansella halocellulosilytica]|uniref:hypothetical protein n=1 Tax=Evansella halocellulosilytica TaxID=2011013 RepID=UPI000BB96AEE|nr:hypothetical protein [Evansella halocellulosilytica]
MNRLVGVCLFTFLGFLVWFYFAANHSTVDDWWTVKTIGEITSNNQSIKVISPVYFAISPIKVLIGLAIFILLGALLYFIVMKRK